MEKEGRVPSYLEKIDRILYDGNRNNEIFENWSYYRIEKCLEDHGIQSGFACSRKHLTEDGLPHLRPYNVGVNGKLDLSEVAYLPEKMVDTKLYGLKKGDIIFNNTNSKELVGKSAIVEQDLHCGFSNHLTRLRVKTSMVRPEWFLLTLRLHWLSGYFLKKSRKWIGQAGVNPDAILRIEIPVPPVHIQSKIIDDIQKSTQCMEEIYKLQQEIENNMNVLRPSIFKYFILNKS
jgi:type I restriction enzyme S subunit